MKPRQLKLAYPEKKPRYVSHKRGRQLFAKMIAELEARYGKGK